jgi:hypothetical protein
MKESKTCINCKWASWTWRINGGRRGNCTHPEIEPPTRPICSEPYWDDRHAISDDETRECLTFSKRDTIE